MRGGLNGRPEGRGLLRAGRRDFVRRVEGYPGMRTAESRRSRIPDCIDSG